MTFSIVSANLIIKKTEMSLKIKDLTPEKIKETVEVLELLKKLGPERIETLEILLDRKQTALLEESIESYHKGEPTYPIESILTD